MKFPYISSINKFCSGCGSTYRLSGDVLKEVELKPQQD